DRFVDAFQGVDPASIEMLRAWLTPDGGLATSQFAADLIQASVAWRKLVELLEYRKHRVNATLPELEKQIDSPACTDDDKQALRSAQAASRLASGRLAKLTGEYWIAVLEEYGVLPNYTLFDQVATLDVGLSWTNPESEEIETEHLDFQRGAALALSEFAPGAQFYGRGLQIDVDAVDLGMEAEAVHQWSLCAACGYAEQLDATQETNPPSVCPRCGDGEIADSGQRLEILELTHSTAEIRRDEALVSDRDDERIRSRFEIITTAQLDPVDRGYSWGEKGSGFGSTYYRALTVRWINVGKPPHGSAVTIGSDTRPAKLFRVCEGCGKLDKDTSQNAPHEHRAWCPFRNQYKEQTRSIALSHTLRTQGLVLPLPRQITLADEFSLPSLAAAIRLGLRTLIGGEPDHLAILPIKAPLPDGRGTADALLLHDLVPGGTGYLTNWAKPAQMHNLLVTAWRIVKDCECRSEDRLACHRCLLPFVGAGRQVPFTSRATAERHLATVLRIDNQNPEPDFNLWTLTESIDSAKHLDAESVLEHRFQETVLERIRAVGATVKQTPGVYGNTATITQAGSPLGWTLRPQPVVGNTRPDFVLESNNRNIPWVYIYTDGWQYHASQAHNELASDAEKRSGLRDQGHVVLGVTSADVDAAQAKQPGQPVLSTALIGHAMSLPELQATPKAYQLPGINPIDWLIEWFTNPDHKNITKAARAVPLALSQGSKSATAGQNETLSQVAHRVLRGTPDPVAIGPTRQVKVWQQGRLAAGIELLNNGRVAISLVVDDSDEALSQTDSTAWREWLRFSNAMALRDWPTTITTCSLVQAGEQEKGEPGSEMETAVAGLPAAWVELLDNADNSAEQAVLRQLARANILNLPQLGEEGPDGIALGVSWTRLKVAIETEPMPSEDKDHLEAAGWKVLPANAENLLDELALAGVT
ncbi:MAG: DUF1998 domain-containing protein, partial [Micrococcales bacterium]|nr:DUF1998 domain-containing protein [Micrococcales bacterium]